ncbi:MAG: porin family protein [Myxococcota bacterium]|nr:porin family protein [Myxococcota bacterium]
MKLVAAAIAAACVAIAPRARAVEHEHHAGVDGGVSMLAMNGKTDVGAGIGAHWAYGLSDAFNLMVEAAWSPVAPGEKVQGASTPRTRPASVGNAGAGVGYVLDVLRWVPYAGLLLSGYALGGGTMDRVQWRPGVTLALGLDYRFGRSWAGGFAFRQHMLVTDTSTYPSFTQFLARFEYTFGW